MLTLRDNTFRTAVAPATAWLLADCMEYRGKQDLWSRRRAETLNALRRQAIIQSVESSNRIEGVTVPQARLRPLVLGGARPRDRSEEELAGYRNALQWIFTRRLPFRVDGRIILHLHRLAQGGTSGDAGQFKAKDNEIIEIRPGVGRIVRFRPTSAAATPETIRELCGAYEKSSAERTAPSLLLIATFVFDFLCVHPFRDGNGRVSRLLTTLLLRQHGFIVAQFISLERLVEETKDEYYRVLGVCSHGWAEGRNEIAPWWNYFLTILRRAYAEFEQKVERPPTRGAKTDLVRQTLLARVGSFTLADLQAEMPAVSAALIKKVLGSLRNEGLLQLTGRGRSAVWQVSSPDRRKRR